MQQSQRQAVEVIARVLDGAALPRRHRGGESRRRAVRRARWCRSSRTARCATWERSTRCNGCSPPSRCPTATSRCSSTSRSTRSRTRAPRRSRSSTTRSMRVVAMGKPAAKSLVNALLRRYLREREALDARAASDDDPVARCSYPRWWIDRVRRDYPARLARGPRGGQRAAAARAARQRARDHARRAARALRRRVHRRATGGCGGHRRRRTDAGDGAAGLRRGRVRVQDLGAQLAAPLLDCADGMRVLDACAAPGGKTTHLVELADVEMLALDRDDGAARARARESRAAASSRVACACACVAGDARAPDAWWDGRPFDAHPGRRAVHGVRASCAAIRTPNGCDARATSRASRASRRDPRTRSGRCSRPAACCCTRRARSFATENEARVAQFLAGHGRALREYPHFPPRCRSTRAGNSCLRSPARRTIRTDFSTRCFARPDARAAAARRPSRGARVAPPAFHAATRAPRSRRHVRRSPSPEPFRVPRSADDAAPARCALCRDAAALLVAGSARRRAPTRSSSR